ncbi:MAG TPA: HEAT repeat domain-containing protein [Polyangiaceae bacterium]|nr:HEAT repeat domain-containing protein [Polyangiaceae bacterium]
MGLFDIFSKKKADAPRLNERDLARYERLVGSKLSQNIDRQEAIDTLARMGTAGAARVLLKRFDWALDPSITDQEEKETCVRGIVAAGDLALEPVRAYCKKAESLTWPLRVLKSIVPPESYSEELLALLDQYDTEYVRNTEPKVQLIAELGQFKSEDVRVALEPFLQDASEPVRFATVTSVFELGFEASTPALIAALAGEESQRIKNRIAQRLAELGWSVPSELKEAAQSALPSGYGIQGQRVVAA